jgi:Icc-related predicted phosphoesterase
MLIAAMLPLLSRKKMAEIKKEGKKAHKLKIHVANDLHMEGEDKQVRKGKGFRLGKTDADVTILAGDIGNKTRGLLFAERHAQETKKPVLYVPGNHEYYGSSLNKFGRQLKELHQGREAKEVHVLDNAQVVLSGVRFLGTTLWTDFKLFGEEKLSACQSAAENGMNDYKRIKWTVGEGDQQRRRACRPLNTMHRHERDIAWLEERLAESFDGPTVVISHHAPHLKSVDPKYHQELLTAAYASDLSRLFEKKPSLWIHGHTHFGCDYPIGSTRVVSNPRGYPGQPGTGIPFAADKCVILEW